MSSLRLWIFVDIFTSRFKAVGKAFMSEYILSPHRYAPKQKPKAKPKRTVVHRSPSHTVRLLHIPYLQADAIEADSSLERDFVHVAALFPATTHIEHQPFRMDLEVGSYTPDFLIRFRDASQCVVEVKPQELVKGHERKLEQASEMLARNGLIFILALDTHIRSARRVYNAMMIRRYGKSLHSSAQAELIFKILERNGEAQVSQLMQDGIGLPTLAHLACLHRIELSPQLGFDDEDVVRLPKPTTQGESDAVRFASWLAA